MTAAAAAATAPGNLLLRWPATRLGEALDELARRAQLGDGSGQPLVVPESLEQGDSSDAGRWMEWAAARRGLEAEAIDTPAPELEALLLGTPPALLRIQDAHGIGYLVLLKARGSTVYLIGPDLAVHRRTAQALRDELCAPWEVPFAGEIDRLLAAAEVPQGRRAAARAAMLRDRLAAQHIGRCWLLRPSLSTSLWCQLGHERMARRVLWMVAVFAAMYAVEIAGWGLVGKSTLNGRLEFGWLAGWILLVLSLIPLRLLGRWLDASFALDFGRILKARLLAGALRSDLETVTRQGVGQLLGRVMESQALESLALNGGFGVLVALLELAFAASILLAGAGGGLHVLLLLVWLALTLAMSWRYAREARAWTLERLDLTQGLIERMVGHRTRLAQERAERRDAEEDLVASHYLATSRAMDRSILPIVGAMPRGWVLVGLLGIAPAFVRGSADSAGLAIALGGILLANRALTGISGGYASVARAAIAWNQVSALFRSAYEAPGREPFLTSVQRGGEGGGAGGKLMDARDLTFRYDGSAAPVLRGVDLSIRRGDRILLEGPSGGGKSTLAALLVGLRRPVSGSLLLNGLDRHTWGDSWHRLATEAPQFHQNHILTGTLGFNLLMGRNWPASEEELEEARGLCVELGLGELLARMPSGMRQMVGETGWQLSHGERSRIFLARALLQKAQLTVLDESFAALDPDTLKKCLLCAFRRAPTLMVIAHP
jgi:ATP-binding cassette, subfamily B, bacterial